MKKMFWVTRTLEGDDETVVFYSPLEEEAVEEFQRLHREYPSDRYTLLQTLDYTGED